ncbi:hypothetical protein Lalb_Chr24g0403241 [Lupinus albus]|uniref:Uncharacterized protein n=1 Tax=Lupinus albus TaxID=3870 RepID=A0A6A4NIR7_LUPAL|nr:hypothetical protein Lalb_Chr24g0403241 [Lupinus albus]
MPKSLWLIQVWQISLVYIGSCLVLKISKAIATCLLISIVFRVGPLLESMVLKRRKTEQSSNSHSCNLVHKEFNSTMLTTVLP